MDNLILEHQRRVVQVRSKLKPSIDYLEIIASLNLLTDTSDTAYDGTNPTLAGMETELDIINGEIITA